MAVALDVLTELQVRVLKKISSSGVHCDTAPAGKSKLKTHFGAEFLNAIQGKCVIDFGCGKGFESVEMAQSGAERVIGIDVWPDVLESARRRATAAGVESRCVFATKTDELADMIVSLDAFEHFADPSGILELMASLLKPDGEVRASFGPTWYHPHGGHLFSVFPWAHVLFSEKALIRWRLTFKSDGATRFGEVAGGLNQMSIARFEKLVDRSPLKFTSFETVPIRAVRLSHNRLTREFTTSIVRCRLGKR